VLLLSDQTIQQVRAALGTCLTFCGYLRTLTRYAHFRTWTQLFACMYTHLELTASP
jgi:hypothetical protein